MWPTFDVKSLEIFNLMLTVDDGGVRSGGLLRRSALSSMLFACIDCCVGILVMLSISIATRV